MCAVYALFSNLSSEKFFEARERGQVGQEGGQAIIPALRPSGLDDNALTFHIAQVAQGLAKSFETALSPFVRMGTPRQITYSRRPFRALSFGRAK